MNQIINAAFASNLTMFGQGVADYYVHADAATRFYRQCNDNGESYDKYSDSDYMPDTIDRFLLPKDLDFYTNTSNVDIFLQNLKNRNFSYTKKYNSSYDRVINGTEIQHLSIIVTFNIPHILREHVNNLTDFAVLVDILHHTDISTHMIPIGIPDMECKCLIITPDNDIKVSKSICNAMSVVKKLETLNRILDEIKNKKTKLLNPNTDFFRIKSMLERGWTLYTDELSVYKTSEVILENGCDHEKCLICLDDLIKDKYQIKMSCCNARYDPMCFMRYMKKSTLFKCPQCRDEKLIVNEYNMIKKLVRSIAPETAVQPEQPLQATLRSMSLETAGQRLMRFGLPPIMQELPDNIIDI